MQLEDKLGKIKEELLIYKTKFENKNVTNKEVPKTFFEKHH